MDIGIEAHFETSSLPIALFQSIANPLRVSTAQRRRRRTPAPLFLSPIDRFAFSLSSMLATTNAYGHRAPSASSSTTSLPSSLVELLDQNPTHINLFLLGITIGEVGAMQLQKYLETRPLLQVLELRGSCIGHQGAMCLAKGLRLHPCIQHLGLSRNGLDHLGALAVIKSLHDTPLQSLDLSGNSLPDAVGLALAEYLTSDGCVLKSLALEENGQRNEGCSAIANALLKNTTLRNLNLANNRCAAQGSVAIARMLESNTTLLTLNLSHNEVPLDGARAIAEAISSNRSLRSLVMHHSPLLKALGERGQNLVFHEHLKELNLSFSELPPTNAKGLADALQEARHLCALSLAHSQGGDASMSLVLGGVSFMVSLVYLDLSHCAMTVASLTPLLDIITCCTELGTLMLDDNHLGEESAMAMSQVLAKASCLTKLSLRGNRLKGPGMLAILGSLHRRTGVPLESLQLANNGGDADSMIMIFEGLAAANVDNLNLIELDVSGNFLSRRLVTICGRVFDRMTRLSCISINRTLLSEILQTHLLTHDVVRSLLDDDDLYRSILDDTGHQDAETAAVSTQKRDAEAAMRLKQSRDTTTAARSGADDVALYNNFNGTTSTWHSSDPTRRAATGTDSAAAATTAVVKAAASLPKPLLPSPGKKAAAAVVAPEDSLLDALSSPIQSLAPGLSPIGGGASTSLPSNRRRMPLNDPENNIGNLCVSDAQLRMQFSLWDKDGNGYLSVSEFEPLYAKAAAACVLDSDRKRMRRMVDKYAKDGKIFFDEFCVLMLQLASC